MAEARLQGGSQRINTGCGESPVVNCTESFRATWTIKIAIVCQQVLRNTQPFQIMINLIYPESKHSFA